MREIGATLLTAEWTWDIRFQRSLLWFFCAHRFIAHAGLICFIYHQTSHFLRRRALRESCCAGFYPRRGKSLHIALFARFKSEVGFPPSSRKKSGHNCALYMVKCSFVWRKRLAAHLACKVLRPRWTCAKADKCQGKGSTFKLQMLKKFTDPMTKMRVRSHY